MFDWVQGLATDTTLTAKIVGAAVVVVFIVFHMIASKMSLARIIVAAISGGVVIALLFGGINFVADLITGEMVTGP